MKNHFDFDYIVSYKILESNTYGDKNWNLDLKQGIKQYCKIYQRSSFFGIFNRISAFDAVLHIQRSLVCRCLNFGQSLLEIRPIYNLSKSLMYLIKQILFTMADFHVKISARSLAFSAQVRRFRCNVNCCFYDLSYSYSVSVIS